jgi:hypothetical protein
MLSAIWLAIRLYRAIMLAYRPPLVYRCAQRNQ